MILDYFGINGKNSKNEIAVAAKNLSVFLDLSKHKINNKTDIFRQLIYYDKKNRDLNIEKKLISAFLIILKNFFNLNFLYFTFFKKKFSK